MNVKKSIISFAVFISALFNINIAYAISDNISVYSARKEHLIKPLFDEFTKDTGIKVSYLTGKGGALIERLKLEGKNTKADVFMTVDAGNLWYAATQNLFQPLTTQTIKSNIPNYLRDPEGLWTGLSVRARTIVYNANKVKPKELSTYAALAKKKWRGRLCLRTSKKIYTKSLVASIIYNHGDKKAANIIGGWVDNLAATPNAKDSHIMNAIIAGQCDVGLVNTYYYKRLIEKNTNAPLKLFWANQDTTGTHVNISGAGITKYAKHPQAAVKLLEWLSSSKAQKIYSSLNGEYPANQNINPDKELILWGGFIQDNMNLSVTGKLQSKAVKLMQTKGYK